MTICAASVAPSRLKFKSTIARPHLRGLRTPPLFMIASRPSFSVVPTRNRPRAAGLRNGANLFLLLMSTRLQHHSRHVSKFMRPRNQQSKTNHHLNLESKSSNHDHQSKSNHHLNLASKSANQNQNANRELTALVTRINSTSPSMQMNFASWRTMS